ncbi:MAG TPA: hypothetical protein VHY84_13430 [Bryobacteraceae bacterium]|jgi:hypothetical protein|nr:hypothetical protein [Bryobacteraceae bacterium]
MSLKLIGIVLVSVIGFAQAPPPAPDPGNLWRMIRSALITPTGDRYFQQIKDAQIPPEHRRFSGNVVSQTSPNELIVKVDNPVGDAILRLPIAVKRPVAVDAPVHFEGVVRAYSSNPYRLTIEVLPEDIEGLY